MLVECWFSTEITFSKKNLKEKGEKEEREREGVRNGNRKILCNQSFQQIESVFCLLQVPK
jgi:hypothetical protein